MEGNISNTIYTNNDVMDMDLMKLFYSNEISS